MELDLGTPAPESGWPTPELIPDIEDDELLKFLATNEGSVFFCFFSRGEDIYVFFPGIFMKVSEVKGPPYFFNI